MKLVTSHMRYLTPDDWRVLTAVELGSRNHEVVPTQIIHSVGGLRLISGTNRAISDLARLGLISKLRNAKYDGYRLLYMGYDYLGLKLMLSRDTLVSVGTTIGVGKELDIYAVADAQGAQRVLKIHRLGRTSFRTVKKNRDYLRNRQTLSWMYLLRLAAEKEYQFMLVLHQNGFPVPEPFDYSRHQVLMEWIPGTPMRALRKHAEKAQLYLQLMAFIVKLACHGLIHCDYNEFNIIIRDEAGAASHEEEFVVIDFPQCISIDHVDAESYFDRDVEGIVSFFAKKLNYRPHDDETMLDTDGFGDGFRFAKPNFKRDVVRCASLDVEVQASGYAKKRTGVQSQEDTDLEGAVAQMRGLSVEEENDEGEYSEGEYSEGEYSEEEYSEEEYSEENATSENERIISALSSGAELKMDKLGNYILE